MNVPWDEALSVALDKLMGHLEACAKAGLARQKIDPAVIAKVESFGKQMSAFLQETEEIANHREIAKRQILNLERLRRYVAGGELGN